MSVPAFVNFVLTGAQSIKDGCDAGEILAQVRSLSDDARGLVDEAGAGVDYARDETFRLLLEFGRQRVKMLGTTCIDFENIYKCVESIDYNDVRLPGLQDFSRMGDLLEADKAHDDFVHAMYAAQALAGDNVNEPDDVLLAYGALGTISLVGGAAAGGLKATDVQLTDSFARARKIVGNNGTMAWLEGKEIKRASAGVGTAQGNLILGGLLAGPAVLYGGLFLKSQQERREALTQLDEDKLKKIILSAASVILALRKIDEELRSDEKILARLGTRFARGTERIAQIVKLRGTDWDDYTMVQRQTLMGSLALGKCVKKLLASPLLTLDGSISEEMVSARKLGEMMLTRLTTV